MIVTTYYSNLRNLPPSFVPVSISISLPKWVKGMLQFSPLAPTYAMMNATQEQYVRMYNAQLSKLDAASVSDILHSMTSRADVALVCYEKPGDFCHRHLVALWLNRAIDANVFELLKGGVIGFPEFMGQPSLEEQDLMLQAEREERERKQHREQSSQPKPPVVPAGMTSLFEGL